MNRHRPFLLVACLLAASSLACSVAVDNTPPTPDCDPGSPAIALLYTSASEPAVSQSTAEWAGVRDCVEIPNHEPSDVGHSWCCWKVDSAPAAQ